MDHPTKTPRSKTPRTRHPQLPPYAPEVMRISVEAEVHAQTVYAYLQGFERTRPGNKRLIRLAAEKLGLTHLLPTEEVTAPQPPFEVLPDDFDGFDHGGGV